MTYAVEVVFEIDRNGYDEAATLVAGDVGGHEFPNSGKEFIEVVNGDASPINVTIITPGLVDGQAIGDRVVVVPATDRTKIGPFPPEKYNNANGMVQFDLSAITSVTLGVFSY
ncbi:hypothetical protein LCGC14_0914810 [marine sediment metagenome]|uniref:Uncharacterized protein n=1 Tax=marine sediment metagenome TaxID=412755 RepID=A0A0F9PDA7_9ZZZZ